MPDDGLALMVEGEERDQTTRENPITGEEERDPMNARGVALADIDGHVVRRAITVGEDEVLCLNHNGDLSVASREFIHVKSAGDYHCTCDEHFDGPVEAREHLLSVREAAEGADDGE